MPELFGGQSFSDWKVSALLQALILTWFLGPNI